MSFLDISCLIMRIYVSYTYIIINSANKFNKTETKNFMTQCQKFFVPLSSEDVLSELGDNVSFQTLTYEALYLGTHLSNFSLVFAIYLCLGTSISSFQQFIYVLNPSAANLVTTSICFMSRTLFYDPLFYHHFQPNSTLDVKQLQPKHYHTRTGNSLRFLQHMKTQLQNELTRSLVQTETLDFVYKDYLYQDQSTKCSVLRWFLCSRK